MSARFVLPAADRDVRKPRWTPRRGGWDCHAHVFGPMARFPIAPDATYESPDQLGGDFLAMLDAVGLEHGVLVQPSVYGRDNAAMLAAVAQAPERLVAVVDLDLLATPDAELEWLASMGVVGLRLRPSGVAPDRIARIAARVRELGWHLDLYIEAVERLAALAPLLAKLDTPYVIEAMGEPRAGQPLDTPSFAALLALVRGGAWVKLSHAYHVDPAGPPYTSAVPFARALIAAAPERCLWGSDWPHPMKSGAMPNDGSLLDGLLNWCDGDEGVADCILIDNPRRFYARAPERTLR